MEHKNGCRVKKKISEKGESLSHSIGDVKVLWPPSINPDRHRQAGVQLKIQWNIWGPGPIWLSLDFMKSQSTLLNFFSAEIKEGVFGVCAAWIRFST